MEFWKNNTVNKFGGIEQQCLRKKRFSKEQKALNYSKHIQKKYGTTRNIKIYKCLICDGYHFALDYKG